MTDKTGKKVEGEGNRTADKRYREHLRESVERLDLDDEAQKESARSGDASRKREQAQ